MASYRGSAVIVADGLGLYCDRLLSGPKKGKWNSKDDADASNFRVMPINSDMEEFGHCLARIFNRKLHSGFFQECQQNYRIKAHSHENIMVDYKEVVYALLYTDSSGEPSILSLHNEDAEIERIKGRLVLIPEDRRHSVEPSNGTSSFIRFVLVPRSLGERTPVNKKLMQEIRSCMSLSTV